MGNNGESELEYDLTQEFIDNALNNTVNSVYSELLKFDLTSNSISTWISIRPQIHNLDDAIEATVNDY